MNIKLMTLWINFQLWNFFRFRMYTLFYVACLQYLHTLRIVRNSRTLGLLPKLVRYRVNKRKYISTKSEQLRCRQFDNLIDWTSILISSSASYFPLNKFPRVVKQFPILDRYFADSHRVTLQTLTQTDKLQI